MVERKTSGRIAIASALESAPGPLTVAEVHPRAGQQAPGLGIATVYRTLKRLQEQGVIRVVALPGGEARYEPRSRGHHHHFHCRCCGGVFDVDVDGCRTSLSGREPFAGGYQVEDHEITLYGVCPPCRAGARDSEPTE